MDNDGIDDNGQNLLRDRITVEQLLLAANVLSVQNPQGPDFDRKKLLEDAHEFALEAREVAFMSTFEKNYHRSEWFRLFAKFGYDRRQQLEFVPYEQAACEITSLKTKKQAVVRLENFISECSDLTKIRDEIRKYGFWKAVHSRSQRARKEALRVSK